MKTRLALFVITAVSVAPGVGLAATGKVCKNSICVEFERYADVSRPTIRARAVIHYTKVTPRFRHYNVKIEGGGQFELRGEGPANYGPLAVELLKNQRNISVQACSSSSGEFGKLAASDCTPWTDFSDAPYPPPPPPRTSAPAPPPPPCPEHQIRYQGKCQIPPVLGGSNTGKGGGFIQMIPTCAEGKTFSKSENTCVTAAQATTCRVEKPGKVYDNSGGGGQEIGELAAGTQGVTLLKKDGADWYRVKWSAWVYSGTGYENALKCP